MPTYQDIASQMQQQYKDLITQVQQGYTKANGSSIEKGTEIQIPYEKRYDPIPEGYVVAGIYGAGGVTHIAKEAEWKSKMKELSQLTGWEEGTLETLAANQRMGEIVGYTKPDYAVKEIQKMMEVLEEKRGALGYDPTVAGKDELGRPRGADTTNYDRLKAAIDNLSKISGQEIEMPYKQATAPETPPLAKLTAEDLAVAKEAGQTTVPGTSIPLTEAGLKEAGMWQETPTPTPTGVTLTDAQYQTLKSQFPGIGPTKADYENAVKSGAIPAPVGVTSQITPTTLPEAVSGVTGATTGYTPEQIAAGKQMFPGMSEADLIAAWNTGTLPMPTGEIPGEPAAPGVPLEGVDTTGWSDAMIASFKALQDMLAKQADQGKIVNPDVEISPEIIAKFEAQAKTELDPYFNQEFAQAKIDLETSAKRLAEDYATKERELGLTYGANLEATQEAYARRGLNISSMRQQAEQKLKEESQRQLTGLQQQAMRGAEDIGLAGERQLGSQFLASNIPSLGQIQIGTTPITGRPGVYGFQYGMQPRELYTPQTGITGEMERTRLFEEQKRKKELLGGEREFRSSFYL